MKNIFNIMIAIQTYLLTLHRKTYTIGVVVDMKIKQTSIFFSGPRPGNTKIGVCFFNNGL